MARDVELKNYINALKPSVWGRFAYYCLPFRKQVVLSNMRQVFNGRLNDEEIRHLAKSFYSHLLTSIKENVLMRFMSDDKIKKTTEVHGEAHLEEIAKGNKGVLILTGHFGNWEFAPIAGILNFSAFKGRFYFIRKTLGAKWIEKILFRRYYRAGLNVIPKKNSLNQVCDALDKNNAVVFVMDQHACVGSKDGVAVDFFGKKAGTYRSLATIARYTNLPVVPAASYRKKDGSHVLAFYPPVAFKELDSSKESLLENTKVYNQQLEALILKHPEQWLWMHRRWKL